MEAALETEGLCKSFGAVAAADEINVQFHSGELVGIVGANGAGKTTFVNLVTGYVKPDRGIIRYRGRDITKLTPRHVTGLGIARSFQMPQLYPNMTTLENVLIALAAGSGGSYHFWTRLRTPRRVDEAQQLLAQFELEAHAEQLVDELPEGGRKILDIAMSFALNPDVLQLDEPTSGVSREDKFDVMDTLINVLKQKEVTVLLIEHDMEVVQRYAERMIAFANGRIIADGDPSTLLTDEDFQDKVAGRI